jgi:hypothetical protein
MSNSRVNITDGHKDQLLTILMRHATPEIRRVLMLEVPAAYNEWCGREVVTVVHTSDGTEVTL